MAKKISKSAKKNEQIQNAPVAVEAQSKPTTPKLIVSHHMYGRWYVYFKDVTPPKDKVRCGCKTAKSAIHYIQLLLSRYCAVTRRISTTASLLVNECQTHRYLRWLT